MMTMRERTRALQGRNYHHDGQRKSEDAGHVSSAFLWVVAPRLRCEGAELLESVRQVKFCKVRPVSGRKLGSSFSDA
jgi:hypothetical protein